MPHKIDTLHIKLPKEFDRRIKLDDSDKEGIINLYKAGWFQNAIAREYNISRRMVSFIIFPERYAICKQQYKERRLDGRYYDKDKNRQAIQNTRKNRKENIHI